MYHPDISTEQTTVFLIHDTFREIINPGETVTNEDTAKEWVNYLRPTRV